MLSRFSDVLQSAADVLAPPATRLEDFEYHWKMVVNFYQNYDESSKIHIEETRVPHHLHQMLQLIVEEEGEQQGGTVGPCLEAVVRRAVALPDALAALARADRPAGARAAALGVAAALLRRTRRPCLHSAHVHRPLQRMLVQCNESPASPTEKEEVELLLTVCGLVRKEPGLANIFTTPYVEDRASLLSTPEDVQRLIPIKTKTQTPKKNPLFEVDMAPSSMRTVSIVRASRDESCRSSGSADDDASCRSQRTVYDENDKFLLIDLLLSYLGSADNQVVLRACEGIMIVCSLEEDDIAHLVTGSPACESVVERLVRAYRAVPADTDPGDVEQLNITWAYVAPQFGEQSARFPGRRQLTAFFSWLDYCDTLMKECHPHIAAHLARVFRSHFLESLGEALGGVGERLLATALLAKCLRQLDSPELIDEFSNWLVGEVGAVGGGCAGGAGAAEWPLLLALVDNCLTDRHDLTLETLRFFEVLVEKGTEHSVERLVLSRLSARGYCAERAPLAAPLQDERDRLNDLSFARERERNREALQQLRHEQQVSEHVGELLAGSARAPRALHRAINSFLLLLPRAVLSDPLGADYEHYVHDAQRHYQLWLDITSAYSWRDRDHAASSTHSYDSRPEADAHLDDYRAAHDTHDAHDAHNAHDAHDAHDAHNAHDDARRAAPPTAPDTDNTARSTEHCPFTQTLVLRSGDAPAGVEEQFDEGPFLRMLFELLATMPDRPYQVNLHLTAIVSKLALLPHPLLHEYLLEPSLPTAPATRTLFKALQRVAARLTVEIPRIKNFKKVIENTRLQLMSEDPTYDEIGDHNQLVESLIVLEEFCKELAAIAFVKSQHDARR